jgi:ABC-type bacteriocin/lantibiotic exporter with double-glycine peptidase domain
VLKNINLNLSSGGIIGLVGASGAGKTTLIDLIIGFIKPKKGNIYIEYDNKKVKFPKKIKNFIGYCGQRDFVFQFSIYKNICLNKDYSMKKIKKILKIVKIWNFVRSLENGIETKIGENGAKLSGGQKQRILLARMLIKNPQIILLDEATSMIDTRIETKIIQNIKKHYNNKLIVIISHRLSTILHSDRLIVLKNGEIVCKGNHHKLIKNCSEYQHLYEKQYIK